VLFHPCDKDVARMGPPDSCSPRSAKAKDPSTSSGQAQGHPASSHVPQFDQLARVYRWMEYATFGPWLWRCRCAFLPELGECRQALVLGDGDGRFTARLLGANREIKVDAVDASAAMLRALARRAAANAARLRVECADVRAWQARGARYDAVVTHFFLDCLTAEEVQALAERMRDALDAGGRWVISEFAVPEGWFGHAVARGVVSMLYAAFGVLTGLRVRTLPDYAAGLRAWGFVLEKRRVWLGGLLASEVWRAEDRAQNDCA
jgi:ubiquinone/menaquinone biosynthesis C-methylase UbiE